MDSNTTSASSPTSTKRSGSMFSSKEGQTKVERDVSARLHRLSLREAAFDDDTESDATSVDLDDDFDDKDAIIEYEGTMSKRGRRWKSWRTRVLKLDSNGYLRYYNKNKLKGCFNIRGMKFSESIVLYTFFLQEFEKRRFCVKIKLEDNYDFYMAVTSRPELDKLKKAMMRVGAEEESLLFNLSPLELKQITNWNHEEVMEFLKSVKIAVKDGRFFTLDELIGHFASEQKLDGKKLKDLTLDVIRQNAKDCYRRVWKEVEDIKHRNYFSMTKYKIMNKLEQLSKRFEIQDVQTWSEELGNPDTIRKFYLNYEEPLSAEFAKKLHSDEEGNSICSDIRGDAKSDFNGEFTKESKLRVKLVISELSPVGAVKSLRKLVSPLVSKIPKLGANFGIFHTSLIIGGFYLEWTDCQLCIPKRIASSMSILAADIDTPVQLEQNPSEIFDKLAVLIANWNVNYKYCMASLTGKKATEGNCQDFVDSVLGILGVELKFEGAMKRFLDDMRSKGTCEPCFIPTAEFAKEFGLEKSSYAFQTHEELDTFVNHLREKSSILNLDYPTEWALLKSFDRAFWLRHLENEKNEAFAPARNVNGDLECPFKDPRDTQSFAR